MAEKVKMKDAGKERDGIKKTDLRRVIGDIVRLKDAASVASGMVGQSTSQAVEQYGLDKTALTFVRRLEGMEATKRQSALRATIDYADKMGYFDQVDMYDDVIGIMREIVAAADARRESEEPKLPPADKTIAALTH